MTEKEQSDRTEDDAEVVKKQPPSRNINSREEVLRRYDRG